MSEPAADEEYSNLPAGSLPAGAAGRIALHHEWPEEVTREWAWGDSTGAGARVCILDSGIERDHPLVGPVQQAVVVTIEGDGALIEEDDEGELCGHGTA